MARIWMLPGVLVLALVLAVWASLSPAPKPADTLTTAFSAARAFNDVEQIARAPHPLGSAEHGRVQAYLLGRMAALGLEVSTQDGALSADAVRRLRDWGDEQADSRRLTNLIGVLPGTDRSLPPILLMAHYDTTRHSPGAADDSAGVAAALEAVRAIRERGPAPRDLVVLLTDAEEFNLDGARAFFTEHPLRQRVGAVVNLEARGGGGRALMFEMGPGNAETVALFAEAAGKVSGGVSSNSLAIFAYDLMPNDTDFTLARDRNLPGLNFAFIGRPEQYHTPASTPENLDRGSLQHLGEQALEVTDTLVRAPTLPRQTSDAVYADVLGLKVISHSAGFGWVIILIAGLALGFAAWGARHAMRLRLVDVGHGVLSGLWFMAAGWVMTGFARGLAGATQIDSSALYYTLLEHTPWMEAGIGLALAATLFALLAGRTARGRRTMAAVMLVAAVVGQVAGGAFSPFLTGAGVIAVGLSLAPVPQVQSRWGGWLGLTMLVLAFGVVAQVAAPVTAHLFLWTALISALAAALAAVIDARLEKLWSYAPAALAAVIGGAALLTFAHPMVLAVGMLMPGAFAILALPFAMLASPFAPTGRGGRMLGAAAIVVVLLAAGVSVTGRIVEPVAAES